MPNGDFSLKSSPPVSASTYQTPLQSQQPRSLSYDTSSVSYPPQQDSRQPAAPAPKPAPPSSQSVHSHNPPPGQQHGQQQMPFPTPQMYGNYPYLNMYNPVNNVGLSMILSILKPVASSYTFLLLLHSLTNS